MHLLTLGRDPAITIGFFKQLEAARPGKYTAATAHSPAEFESLAIAEKDKFDLVLLGAAQTDPEVENAKRIVNEVFGQDKMRVVRLPPSLLTKEGKEGGMLRWFLEQVGDA